MLRQWVTAALVVGFPGIHGNPPAADPVPWVATQGDGREAPPETPSIRVVPADPSITDRTLTKIRGSARTAWVRLQETLAVPEPGPVRIVVHPALDRLPSNLGVEVPEGTPGFALLLRGEIHLLLREAGTVPPDDLRTVLSHELIHIMLQQAASPHGAEIPRWFHEGLAQTLAGGSYYSAREEDFYLPLRAGQLPPLSNWSRGMPVTPSARRMAYAATHSFVLWLWSRMGADGLQDLLHHLRQGDPWSQAFLSSMEGPVVEFELRWREETLQSGLARFLEANCFSILLLGVVPLLTLAVVRRLRRERRLAARLAAADSIPIEVTEPQELPPP